MENKTNARKRKYNYIEIQIQEKTGTSILNKMIGRSYTCFEFAKTNYKIRLTRSKLVSTFTNVELH